MSTAALDALRTEVLQLRARVRALSTECDERIALYHELYAENERLVAELAALRKDEEIQLAFINYREALAAANARRT